MNENSLEKALQNYEENVKRSIVDTDIARIRLAHEVASRILRLEARIRDLESLIRGQRVQQSREDQYHNGSGDNYNSCNFNS